MSRRLLVFEGDEPSHHLARTLREDASYEVLSAPDPEEALAFLALETPDVLLIDLGFSSMDGLALARILRRDSRLGRLSLIAAGGSGDPRDRDRAMSAGFDAYLAPPVARVDLMRAVELALQPRGVVR